MAGVPVARAGDPFADCMNSVEKYVVSDRELTSVAKAGTGAQVCRYQRAR